MTHPSRTTACGANADALHRQQHSSNVDLGLLHGRPILRTLEELIITNTLMPGTRQILSRLSDAGARRGDTVLVWVEDQRTRKLAIDAAVLSDCAALMPAIEVDQPTLEHICAVMNAAVLITDRQTQPALAHPASLELDRSQYRECDTSEPPAPRAGDDT